ncbi:MAG: STAS/SEC14 domain-containing protein [Desulfosarcina sp.]|nr:STAS/SEC14 domain-containing protein [Desulfobacterales bacterium]
MLEMIDIGFEKAVAYRVKGKITEEEMTSLFSIFKEKIDKDEKLIVYQEVVSFGGVEFGAIVKKIKFFIDFGISHFSKIAIVTHKKWIHRLVDLEGKIFKNIDIKGFPIEEKDKAVEFLRNANL